MKTFSDFTAIYFLLIVIIGAFFIINLFLAILKEEFSSAHKDSSNTENE